MQETIELHNNWHNEITISGKLENKPFVKDFNGKRYISFFINQRTIREGIKGKEYEIIKNFRITSWLPDVINTIVSQENQCDILVQGKLSVKKGELSVIAIAVNIYRNYREQLVSNE